MDSTGDGNTPAHSHRGGFVCAACDKAIELGSGNCAPSHCCKECKRDVHSYVLCSWVWQPEEGAYFCSPSCIRDWNLRLIESLTGGARLQEGSDELEVYEKTGFRIVRRPEDAEDKVYANNVMKGLVPNSNSKKPQEIDGNQGRENSDKELQHLGDESMMNSRNQDAGDGSCDEADHGSNDLPAAFVAMIQEGSRVQVAFKQSEDDHNGLWWGGLVGSKAQYLQHGTTDLLSYIGYDDGMLEFHTDKEMLDLFNIGKLKTCDLESGVGVSADMLLPFKAQAFCYAKWNTKYMPIGVLLGDGKEKLCDQPLYHAHVVSADLADKLPEKGDQLRRGRRCIDILHIDRSHVM